VNFHQPEHSKDTREQKLKNRRKENSKPERRKLSANLILWKQ
jgi:hypothetical protein